MKRAYQLEAQHVTDLIGDVCDALMDYHDYIVKYGNDLGDDKGFTYEYRINELTEAVDKVRRSAGLNPKLLFNDELLVVYAIGLITNM